MKNIKPKYNYKTSLSEIDKINILERWKSGNNNKIIEIANDFNTSFHRVSTIINAHIKSLIIK